MLACVRRRHRAAPRRAACRLHWRRHIAMLSGGEYTATPPKKPARHRLWGCVFGGIDPTLTMSPAAIHAASKRPRPQRSVVTSSTRICQFGSPVQAIWWPTLADEDADPLEPEAHTRAIIHAGRKRSLPGRDPHAARLTHKTLTGAATGHSWGFVNPGTW